MHGETVKMRKRFNTLELYILPILYLFIYFVFISEKAATCATYNKMIGFHNRDEKCLLRGTIYVCVSSSKVNYVFYELHDEDMNVT
jgi:hypothetical protein